MLHFFSFLLACPIHARGFPLPLANYLRSNIQMKQASNDWQSVDSAMASRVVRRYFHTDLTMTEKQRLDIFLIEGVPAAAMVYRAEPDAKAQAFYLNLGLLLLFDACSDMRAKLYARHRGLCTDDAENAVVFSSCS
tara:strand:+ start:165 stop:572 length:408 start_codon:yes stop_codon:yes gene_type:complete